MKRTRVILVLLLGILGGGMSLLHAFSSGAGAFFSGGPAGAAFGGNCTACHEFNIGTGKVELLGAPRRYRPGIVYDLTVRVTDMDIQGGGSGTPGAGFEVSAEGSGLHQGTLLLTDPLTTQYADANPDYVTHTQAGFDDSVANWLAKGRSSDFQFGWQAPFQNEGLITVFAAGQAVNNHLATGGDHYYATYGTMHFAHPGDADGDTDRDLDDFGKVQQCFGVTVTSATGDCGYVDVDGDNFVSLPDVGDFVTDMTGPTTNLPVDFLLADPIRGGLLYDTWWLVNGAPEPMGDHPLWALRPDNKSNTRTGSVTFRCKECHGWDYKGVDGDYASGSHRTGFGGILGTSRSPREIFELLKAGDPQTGGHDMDAFGMTDRDLWDVVRMTLDGAIDTDAYISSDGSFLGVPDAGLFDYGPVCQSCHGDQGDAINFGTEAEPQYVGTIAAQHPWEFLHKLRFGHPGSPMPSLDLFGWSLVRITDLSAYAATLPP